MILRSGFGTRLGCCPVRVRSARLASGALHGARSVVRLSVRPRAKPSEGVSAKMPYSGRSHVVTSELIILNCVPDAEPQTSAKLAELIDGKGVFTLGQQLAVVRCRTDSDLMTVLREILDRARRGAVPMLHFDGHASADAMATAAGDAVSWSAIYSLFRQINIACGNNLFVTMGACEALRSISRCPIGQPCPLNALLAAWDPILASVVEVGLEAFYGTLFESNGSVDAAVKEMHQAVNPCPLKFFKSKDYLEKGVVGYVRSHCVGDGLSARVSELVVTATKMFPGKRITPELVMEAMQREIADTPGTLRAMARTFLHIEPDGRNEDRFAADLEEVLAIAQAELDQSK